MSRTWITLPDAEARAHPLYGRGGWLVLFALMLMFGLLAGSILLAYLWSFEAPGDRLTEFLKIFAAASIFSWLVILALYGLKSRSFRIAAIMLIIAPWPVLAAVYLPHLPQSLLLGGSIVWLIAAVIWVAYLQRSRRVRVTFEQRILAGPPYLRTEPISAWQPPDAAFTRMTPTLDRPADAIDHYRPVDVADMADIADPMEECWAQALAEYDGDRKKPGLWARAYADARGDEAVAKAYYLKYRAEQLFNTRQEKTRHAMEQQQAAQKASDLERHHEESLTDHQRRIRRAIMQVESLDTDSFDAAVNLIRLLGGTVERKASFMSSSWIVELAGYRNQFPNEEAFMDWTMHSVLPRAKLLLPPADGHGGHGRENT